MVEAYAKALEYLCEMDPEERIRKKHRLPLESYALSDHEFFFTVCARQVGEPFRDGVLAKAVVDAVLRRKVHHHWTLYCYCLMPDHLHFITKLPNEQIRYVNSGARGIVPFGILDQVGQFKSYTTTQIWLEHGGRRPLWQKSSYDRIIRYGESIESAVTYVLDNPVRKGLVERWEDYPYCAMVDPW